MSWDWGELRRDATHEARRLMRDEDGADDAAQEAMVRAWRQRASCRSQDAPGPWLRQIARNEALRVRESTRMSRQRTTDGEIPESGVGSESLETGLVRRLTVAQALAGLTEEDRRLVQLRYGLDLSQVAIAQALGMTETTVRVRLHRIRKRLRSQMEGLL